MKTQKKIYIAIILVLLAAQLLPMTAFGQSALLPAASTVEQPTADPFTSASSSAEENAPADFFDESPLSSATASAPFQAGTCSFVSQCEGTLVRQGSNLDVVISGTGAATKLELIDVNGLVFSLELPDIERIASGNFSADGKKMVIQHENKKLTFLDLLDLQALTKEVPESFNGAQISVLNSAVDAQGSEVEVVLTDGTSVRVLKDVSGKVTQETTTYYYSASNVRRQMDIQFNFAGSITVFLDDQYDANGTVVDGWKEEVVYASNGTTVITRTQTKTVPDAKTVISYDGSFKTGEVRTEYGTNGAVVKIISSQFNAQESITRFEAKTYSPAGVLVETWIDELAYGSDGKTLAGHVQTKIESTAVTSIFFTGDVKVRDVRTDYYIPGGPVSRVSSAHYNAQGAVTHFSDYHYFPNGKLSYRWLDEAVYAANGTTKVSAKQTIVYVNGRSTVSSILYHANGNKEFDKTFSYSPAGKLTSVSQTRFDGAERMTYFNDVTYDAAGKAKYNFTETRSYYGNGAVRSIYKVQYRYGVLSYDLKYDYRISGKLEYFRERGWHANGQIYNQTIIRYNAAGQRIYKEDQLWNNRGERTDWKVWRR